MNPLSGFLVLFVFAFLVGMAAFLSVLIVFLLFGTHIGIVNKWAALAITWVFWALLMTLCMYAFNLESDGLWFWLSASLLYSIIFRGLFEWFISPSPFADHEDLPDVKDDKKDDFPDAV